MATPPTSPSVNSSVCPNFFDTASRTFTAAWVTSTPIPSPGKSKIFRFIYLSVSGAGDLVACLFQMGCKTGDEDFPNVQRSTCAGAGCLRIFDNLARQCYDLVVAQPLLPVRKRAEAFVER